MSNELQPHDRGGVSAPALPARRAKSGHPVELRDRLRRRINSEVIPLLAERLLTAGNIRNPATADCAETYRMALMLLLRLLIVAYAEDQGLQRRNDSCRPGSLKHNARHLKEIVREIGMKDAEAGTPFDASYSYWEEIERLFRAVDQTSGGLVVAKYNGDLSSDPPQSVIGDALAGVRLTNQEFGPILAKLLLDQTDGESHPVDLRSLDVRDFGSIYEVLLENELSIARTDLAVGKAGGYRPARPGDEVAVTAGRPYLDDRSGARKASGSYFTKRFAVEHLLDQTLEPALADHLARLDALDDNRAAADALFDFRVADIAMGSGGFLLGAIDRIGRALAGFLAKRPLPDVIAELSHLRDAACESLGGPADSMRIEQAQLLRRQVARRCVYGVDLDPVAVELARAAVQLHTFVPGLPRSFLDHNFVAGNSLVGIATIEEASEWLSEIAGSPLCLSADRLLGPTKETTRTAVMPAQALFDVLAAARIDSEIRRAALREAVQWVERPEALRGSSIHRRAREVLGPIAPLHFPSAFPEIFLRRHPGFDVILGNPPWEEATVEEDSFWARNDPELRSLSQGRQETAKRRYRRDRPDLVTLHQQEKQRAALLRRVLTSGPFPGMGAGDPDVYKAFAWRFWNLVSRDGGRMGAVLPRSVMAASGSEPFRREVFTNGRVDDITFLQNRAGWVFDDAEHRYTIVLMSLRRGAPGAVIPLRGPFADAARYAQGMAAEPVRLPVAKVLASDSAALPMLPCKASGEVFVQLRKAPRLDFDDGRSWLARPYRELDATNDKRLMALGSNPPQRFWPVFKGESFDIWNNDTRCYYASADPDRMKRTLGEKRVQSAKLARSVFHGFSPSYLQGQGTLACNFARIAFRDIARGTDTRTVRAALVTPGVFLTNTAPFLVWLRGDESDQAYLLGMLCSIPLDWYARRFVEIHVNFHIFAALPIPRPSRDTSLWRRAVALAGRLACPDERWRQWADAAGVECGPLEKDEKADMIHELDAVAARLYGLSERRLAHIFETFHEGWDYEKRLLATIKHFRRWAQR